MEGNSQPGHDREKKEVKQKACARFSYLLSCLNKFAASSENVGMEEGEAEGVADPTESLIVDESIV